MAGDEMRSAGARPWGGGVLESVKLNIAQSPWRPESRGLVWSRWASEGCLLLLRGERVRSGETQAGGTWPLHAVRSELGPGSGLSPRGPQRPCQQL